MTSTGRLLAAWLTLYLAHGAAATAGEAASDTTFLPVRYAADRFFVTPITVSGQELALFTDTGGGTNMIYQHAVDRLGLQGQVVEIGGETAHVISLPPLLSTASIPLPSGLSAYGPHYYSAAELSSLIEAANKVVGQASRKSPALVVLKKRAVAARAVTT